MMIKKNNLNAVVEHILRLPIEVVFPRTTVMRIRWIHQSYAQPSAHSISRSDQQPRLHILRIP